MTKFKSLFLLLITTVLFVGCDPSENSNSNDSFAENFGNATSKDFLGQVVDEDNNPIQNVAIKIGSETAQTDVNGVFIIKGASVYEKFAYITAKKTGFIDGSRAMVPTSGSNRVKIMMLSGTVIATVNSGAASEAVLSNGTKVTFDGNFKTEAGAAYSGTVNVIMHHLDPADPNVADKMPGMLFAESTDGQAKVLETYGMINVELRGSAGQKLQISNTAQIEMPITATQLATAPATIPLWHFDETLGYWKEEGSATKQGNKYVGTVSHFSWWFSSNGSSSSSVALTFNVVSTSGNPISNVSMQFHSSNFNAGGTVDSNGQISVYLPANEIFTLYVTNYCGTTIYTSSFGPFSGDTILPNIIINQLTSAVTGNLSNCNNTNVTDGYVLFNYENQLLFSSFTNGAFNFDILTNCMTNNTAFTIQGYDYNNLQTSGAINYNFTSPITNIGNIIACNNMPEFISYQLDNEPVNYILSNLNSGIGSNSLYYEGQGSSTTNNYFFINGNVNTPGTYTTAQFSVHANNVSIGSYSTNNTVSFQLNTVGSVGQYVDMTFNGTYLDTINNIEVVRNINGIAHVLRDN